MQEHYGLTDSAYNELLADGITVADLYSAVKEFKAFQAPVSMISIMHYIDNHGDFTELRNKNDKIAMAVFNGLPVLQRVAIGDYLEFIVDGEAAC